MKTGMFAVAALVAGIAMLYGAAQSQAQTAIFEKPVKSEPGKGWWATDPTRYHDFTQLERAAPDLKINGLDKKGDTITVKKGAVVEIDFPEYYKLEGRQVWGLVGKSGASVDMVITDFQGVFERGIFQLDKPGVRSWKFRAVEAGDVMMSFKFDAHVAPTLDKLAPGDMTINFKVAP